MSVLEKTGNLQVLDAYDVVFFDDLGRFLLKKVGPDVCDPLVESGENPLFFSQFLLKN